MIDPRNDVHANDAYNFFMYMCYLGHLGYAMTGRSLYLILDTIGVTVEEILNVLLKNFHAFLGFLKSLWFRVRNGGKNALVDVERGPLLDFLIVWDPEQDFPKGGSNIGSCGRCAGLQGNSIYSFDAVWSFFLYCWNLYRRWIVEAWFSIWYFHSNAELMNFKMWSYDLTELNIFAKARTATQNHHKYKTLSNTCSINETVLCQSNM